MCTRHAQDPGFHPPTPGVILLKSQDSGSRGRRIKKCKVTLSYTVSSRPVRDACDPRESGERKKSQAQARCSIAKPAEGPYISHQFLPGPDRQVRKGKVHFQSLHRLHVPLRPQSQRLSHPNRVTSAHSMPIGLLGPPWQRVKQIKILSLGIK